MDCLGYGIVNTVLKGESRDNNHNNNNNRANAGTGDIGTINSNDRIAATVYSLGTWFVWGIYV
jgi:hypothetical protein